MFRLPQAHSVVRTQTHVVTIQVMTVQIQTDHQVPKVVRMMTHICRQGPLPSRFMEMMIPNDEGSNTGSRLRMSQVV
jgi:hypothetical protein